ncbi:MAG: 1-acyl-sn-glycerol-3-phosphate acyltransferase [Clostridia bacterium]|nr:1-acyl-sn-glycerol-3-phosphate acyltransferase [Clostridia bacterium]
MLYVFLTAAAAAIPIIDRFHPFLRTASAVWLVPVLFIGTFLALCAVYTVFFVICGRAVNLKKPVTKNSRFYRGLVDLTLPSLFKIARVKVISTGTDKAEGVFPATVVCNHIHAIDPAVILKELPELRLGFIGKKEIYTEMPFVARFMHKLCCLPLDRENTREAAKTILQAIDLIKKKTVSIGVFPEGYTSPDGELHEFRNGAFKIATKSECPIIVCTVIGTDEAVKHLFRKKNTVYFDVLEVIPADEVRALSTAELSERIHKTMAQNIQKRREELCSEK